jgi:transposase InsO family protein
MGKTHGRNPSRAREVRFVRHFVIALLPAWFEDYNEVHPHSGLKFLSPREFLRLSA